MEIDAKSKPKLPRDHALKMLIQIQKNQIGYKIRNGGFGTVFAMIKPTVTLQIQLIVSRANRVG
jgi:hypothetical protein